MSPKTITIIISVLVVLIAGLFGGAYYISRDTGVSTGEVLKNILPFGGGTTGAPTRPSSVPSAPSVPSETTHQTPGISPPKAESTVLQVQKLVATPISGATIDETARDGVRILYADRATGNIFSLVPKTGAVSRVTNTTIPGAEEAIWGENKVILRYLDENNVIKSFSASFVTATATENAIAELKGRFLPDDSGFIVSSPDKRHIFSLSGFGTSLIGTVTNFDGTLAHQIFDSTHTEWLPEWVEEGTITMTTRASAFIPGSVYFLNTAKGTLQKVLGDVNGLTTKTSSNGNSVLFSTAVPNSYETLLYTRKTKTSASFPLRTLPEKCVWSKNNTARIYCAAPVSIPVGSYPDDWYQGIISFSDNLWGVDTDSGAVSLLSRPEETAREAVDAINPFLSGDESYLFFTNKKDGSLWGLRLK